MEETLKFSNAIYSYPESGFTLRTGELAFKTDEITFVTGDNGSGKTTLAKLAAGILKPHGGEVYIMGTRSGALSLGEIGKRVGYLWQNPRQQLFAKSVMEELTFAEEIKNPKMTHEERSELCEAAMNFLEYFDLTHLKDKSSFYLSHGERQRLAIAAVIASGAGYLILDEPTKGLDAKRKSALAALLLKLRHEKGAGMLIISHDDGFGEELGERTVRLSGGEICDG